ARAGMDDVPGPARRGRGDGDGGLSPRGTRLRGAPARPGPLAPDRGLVLAPRRGRDLDGADRISSKSHGGRRTPVRENLRVARFYFLLLGLFTVGRWVQSLGQVEYAKGHHVFSIVTLTFLSSAYFAAFCRKWRGYSLLQA